MHTVYRRWLYLCSMALLPSLSKGQLPIIIEAETGTIGTTAPTAFPAEWFVTTTGGVSYVRNAVTLNTGTANAGSGTRANSNIPDRAERIITYSINVPAPGTYDLFARVNVRGGSGNDAFFYGSSFGTKPIGTDNSNTDPANDWINANNLGNTGGGGAAGVGHNCSSQVVDITDTYLRSVTNGNSTGTLVNWKWIKLSAITLTNLGPGVPGNYENGVLFTVPSAGTYTFQIAGRDAELWIDKLAFCLSTDGASPTPNRLYYTVSNLDSGTAGSTTPPAPPYTPPTTQLPIATGKNKFLGSVYSGSQIANFNRYFNQVTPENDGKWGSVEGTRGTFNWTALDAARTLAKSNGFPFRMHVLVWGRQQPTWMKTLSDAEQVVEIKEWFQAVANRYPDLEFLEVVNEALNDPPNNEGANTSDAGSGNYLKALRSLNAELNTTPGTYDWVVNAFKLARQYFPCTTKLVINDYGIENNTALATTYLGIINQLKADNLLDVVGIQAHSFSTKKYSASQSFEDHTAFLRSNLDLLASAGIPIQITELDIDGDVGATDAERDANQLSEYQRIFGLYWNHPAVTGITLWGYLNGHWRSAQLAYLVDPCTNTERPALRDYLNNTLGNTPNSVRASGNPDLGNRFIPSICGVPASLTVACLSSVPVASTAAITVTPTNCPGPVAITVADVATAATADSPYLITRTWSTTDACGNSRSASQRITVTNPGSVSLEAATTTLTCTQPVVSLSAVGAGTLLWSTGETTSAISVSAAGPYSVTLTGAGGCESIASVTVSQSLTTPEAPNASSLTVTLGATNVNLTVTNCAGTVSWNGVDGTASLPVSATAVGTVSYTAVCKVGSCASVPTQVTLTVVVPAPTLSVSHRDDDRGRTDNNIIRPYLQLNNESSSPIPYSEITIRYWLTVEEFAPMTNLFVDWAQLGTNRVKMTYVPLTQPRAGALGYVEYSFDASAGQLPANGNSGEIQSRIGKQNWTNLNELDDYSFANRTAYTKTDRITVYRNGVLAGGVEPAVVAPVRALAVYSENKNARPNTNQIRTHLKLANEGSVPVDYSQLTLRYWFSAEGNQPLVYTVDYAELGNSRVQGRFVKENRAGTDTYLELRFAPELGQLNPLSSTGIIQQRINKSDWSDFDETNDYSYRLPASLAANPTITAYLNGSLVYGQEPGVAGARLAAGERPSGLQVSVLGNPIQGDVVQVAVRGVEGQPLRFVLTDTEGRLVAERSVAQSEAVERHHFSIRQSSAGVLLLNVSTNQQSQTIKLLKP